MNTLVIVNPQAGTADGAGELLGELDERTDIHVHRSTSREDACRAAAGARSAGFDGILVGGGDGTINDVINSVGDDREALRFGVLPIGTGNDLSRTLAIPKDARDAWRLFITGAERRIDLVSARWPSGHRLFVNAAAGGFSGQVNEVLDEELKSTWGPLAYARGAAMLLPDLTGYRTTIAVDDEPARSVEALNIVVANGRSVAGGLRVAPEADPADGLLDVVIVEWAPTIDLMAVAARLVAGDYTRSNGVYALRAKALTVASQPGMWFNVDGELVSNEPIHFHVLAGALRIVGGTEE